MNVHRRHTKRRPLRPEAVKGLPPDHPAVIEGRTLFPSTVYEVSPVRRILVSGENQTKLGNKIVRGPWRGMPIYALTLEERATCPETCHHWATCYGNGMPLAWRNQHSDEFETLLGDELRAHNDRHRKGFAVRLHILGDFYSVEYVVMWRSWLAKLPALHVFGYTAWPADTAIGAAVDLLNQHRRFYVRRSVPEAPGANGEVATAWITPQGDWVSGGLVCPAQTGKTDCCGTCGLCWSPAFWNTPVIFVAHGAIGRGKSGDRRQR